MTVEIRGPYPSRADASLVKNNLLTRSGRYPVPNQPGKYYTYRVTDVTVKGEPCLRVERDP